MSDAVVSILRLLLFAISICGYGVFIHNRFKIRAEFLPAVIFSGIVVTLFVFSILNMLEYAAYAIYLVGFLLLFWFVIFIKGKKSSLSAIFCYGLIFFAIAFLYYVVFLRSAKLYAYDDFSHWGTVVKDIYLNNRLPNFSSEIIAFPTYPPATALFAYYFVKFVGFGENKMLMAQMLLTLGFAVSMFGLTKRGKRGIVSNVACSLSIMLLLALFQQGTTTMLVDTVLPIAAIANTAVIIYSRNDIKVAAALSALLSITTLLIKNSGLLWVIVNIGLLLYFFLKSKLYKNRKSLIAVIIAVILPFAMLLVWQKHVDMVFPSDADIGHHAMNAENYKKNLDEKPKEQIVEITTKFIKSAFDPKTRSNRVMVTWCVVSIVLCLLSKLVNMIRHKQSLQHKRVFLKGTFHALWSMVVFYLLYLVGVYGMYLFSMPPQEASSFVSFSRYVISATIYVVGVFTIGILYDAEQNDNTDITLINAGIVSSVILTVAYCFMFTKAYDVFYKRPMYETTRVYKYDSAFKSTEINNEHSYLLYIPSSKTDAHFTFYLSKYKLQTTDFEIVSEITDNFEYKIMEYNHFVIVEQDEAVKQYIEYQK